MSIIDISIINRAIYKIALFILFIGLNPLYAQESIEIEGMKLSYRLAGDSIHCNLSAPTNGWLLIGFNSENSIEQADLKFFAIKNKTVIAVDHQNVGGRNYPNDIEINGSNNIYSVWGEESAGKSIVSFVLPMQSNDTTDFKHETNKSFWLILAYSVSDDFDHHSRMRKHLPFVWKSP